MLTARRTITLGIAAGGLCFAAAVTESQQPAAAPSATPPQMQSSSSAADKPKKQKYSHANDFLILGTVFDEKGLSFPGVHLRIRRGAEKKSRWETYTNSRGEFAVRVPQGSDYELFVHAKGFADQTRALDAKTGMDEARIVFRMDPVTGENK